ncbi:MAG TPA: discoidin domain-containing protein [Terriglobales bacterium]|nr:discoidin domain-containing protein [Terriglobales bacterium]
MFLVLLALVGASRLTHATPPASETTIVIDGRSVGRVFDGVGGISSSSSRLLYDYPEPQRSQILDYLFKPKYGASLHMLKIEIGSDSNSTVASEPSHMRTPEKCNCGRGIEWWLMKEAQRRNPNIKFYGLTWGAPGWLKNGLWSEDHVRFVMSWLDCARKNGFRIDYVGGANESYQPRPKPEFFVRLRKALNAKFPSIKIVATDSHTPPDYWAFISEIKAEASDRDAIDIYGEHDICHWRTTYQHCDASRDALASGKPLWNSEQSSQDAAAGAAPLARAMNRNYIDARVTGNLNWAMIAAFYGNTDTGGTGLMLAETPWTGHYTVNKSIWVDAHTTQFAQPGWQYLDGACGYLKSGASSVTLRSPNSDDYTIIIETTDTAVAETVSFLPSEGLSKRPLSLWVTDLSSEDPADWFVDDGLVKPTDSGTKITLKPNHLYTLSTTRGQRKGSIASHGNQYEESWLPLPYREDFEHIAATGLAQYFQDAAGAFEARPCEAGRVGGCYEQVITQRPYLWHEGGKLPATIMGDPSWWGDYEVSVDMLPKDAGAAVELLGRLEKYNPDVLAGYHLQVNDAGKWKLYSQDVKGTELVLASGSVSFSAQQWHRIGLRFEGPRITASIDGHAIANVTDEQHRTGQIGFALNGWQRAQFDNLSIVKTTTWPRFVPQSKMKASATSAQPGVFQHHKYTADRAIDGRHVTRWIAQFDPPLPLPQAITLDLGRPYTIYGLTYQPPLDMRRKATITRYVISISNDGKQFREISRGRWNDGIATKIAAWSSHVDGRFVRLEATEIVAIPREQRRSALHSLRSANHRLSLTLRSNEVLHNFVGNQFVATAIRVIRLCQKISQASAIGNVLLERPQAIHEPRPILFRQFTDLLRVQAERVVGVHDVCRGIRCWSQQDHFYPTLLCLLNHAHPGSLCGRKTDSTVIKCIVNEHNVGMVSQNLTFKSLRAVDGVLASDRSNNHVDHSVAIALFQGPED